MVACGVASSPRREACCSSVWIAPSPVRGSMVPAIGRGYFVVPSLLYFAVFATLTQIDEQTFVEWPSMPSTTP